MKRGRLPVAVLLGVMLALPLGGLAQMSTQEIRHSVVGPVGPNNPRNSEAAIVALKDGSLLLGWSEFYAGSGADDAPARLVGRISRDGGKTWGEKYTLVENDGRCNVMEVNFLRLRSGELALFYCQTNTSDTDCRVMMRTSSDEGKTFGPSKLLSPPAKYAGLTNGRCIRLASGRILLEAYEGGDSYCCLSDDDGKTWRDGGRVKPEGGPCYEPACIELKDGRVLMLMRTGLGGQFASTSRDGGETWSKPEPTMLTGSTSPVAISRVPKTGHLLAVWNNDAGRQLSRNPLTAAISRDEGRTWERLRNLEDDPADRFAYPAITWVGGRALITYFNYSGGLSLHLASLPISWFYQ
jgi:predicted neuraminidase